MPTMLETKPAWLASFVTTGDILNALAGSVSPGVVLKATAPAL